MAEHDDTENGPDQATGTGWAENEPASGSLSDRLAYLDSRPPGAGHGAAALPLRGADAPEAAMRGVRHVDTVPNGVIAAPPGPV